MAQTITLASFDRTERDYFARTAEEHGTARKISDSAQQTFRRFARGLDVTVADLTDAIVEGMHADVTRSGTSSKRRTQAGPLLHLWKALQSPDTPTSPTEDVPAAVKREQSITDSVATAERRFALSLLTAEQRVLFDTYSRGFRDGVGSL